MRVSGFRQAPWGLAVVLLLTVVGGAWAAEALKADEELVIYPSFGWRSGEGWRGEIEGMVYEVEPRRLTLPILTRALGLGELTEAEKQRLKSRARLFLVDHEHGKRLTVRLGSKEFVSGKSGQNGVFRCEWVLSREEGSVIKDRLTAEVTAGQRQFSSRVTLLEDEGYTVISDIDDTIKVSHVTDRDALLRAAMVEPYVAVPGMAAVYRGWATVHQANFVYVSGSPWPLYQELSAFLAREGFPTGVFYMREFRLKDGSALQLLKSPEQHKLKSIGSLLDRFPSRRFILVGDSGEGDLEIYSAVAESHPKQVQRVVIRDLPEAPLRPGRREAAERRLKPGALLVFREPAGLGDALREP